MSFRDFLDEDGACSVATAILTSHHAFRRDLARFAQALDRGRVADLAAEWKSFHEHLHGHHVAEDTGIFPPLAAIVPQIAQLTADHARLAPLLDAGDRAFAAADAAAARSLIAELTAMLAPHLASEEEHVFPHLRAARVFAPPATDAEADLYAEGFAWSMDELPPDVSAALDAWLPPILRERLPAARAAYAARKRAVWNL